MFERPSGYPLALTWQGSIDLRRSFVTPDEVCDKTHEFLVGATALISSLDLPKSFYLNSRSPSLSVRLILDMHEIKLDLLVKQLKCIVLSYQKIASDELKIERSNYLYSCQCLYQILSDLNDPNSILKEKRQCDLTD